MPCIFYNRESAEESELQMDFESNPDLKNQKRCV